MNLIGKLLLLTIIGLLSGCAFLFTGTGQKLTFRSDPQGASVYADGLFIGKTPLEKELRKDEFKTITIKKKGYKDKVIPLQTHFHLVGLFNILFPVGFTIDASAGSMFEYEPGKFHTTLTKIGKVKSKSSTYIDRNYSVDYMMFVTSNYYRMKSQCQTTCSSEYVETIAILAEKKYNLSSINMKKYIIDNLADTSSPEDFIKAMESDIKAEGQQVAAFKGKQ